jgi:D-beta-D-heptose 7-phosphate kinase/D-beta-D-heptose 1-phosphate adenosyltransferase
MTPRMVVVGDSLLDRDIDGVAERLSPDAPVPVLDEHSRVTRPGGAALAACLAAAGLSDRDRTEVVLVTAVAGDDAGRELHARLRRAGVEVAAVATTGSTPEKIRLRAGSQALLRLDRGGPPGAVAEVGADVLRLVAGAETVVVSDYGRGLLRRPELRDAIGRRRRATVWDPHPRGGVPAVGVTLVTPNRAELASAFPGPASTIRDLADRTAHARRRWAVGAVVTTLGADGALLVSGEGAPLVVPAEKAVGGDPCGAGDRFATAVGVGLLHGALLTEAVIDAVGVASRFVAAGGAGGRLGLPADAAAPTDAGSPPPSSQPPTAQELADQVRAAGGTVVVAGGCFDLLHAGHISMLDAARRLGDCLIVAMNSDASVRRLKGAGRPVVDQADRRVMLEALASVGAVAVFEEDSPIQLLRRLRPHVFAKGGDYSARDLPEDPVLRSWGGQAVVLPYLTGRSTSALLKVAGSVR